MREINEEEITQPNSTAFFASVSIILFIGFMALFFYTRDIINDHVFEAIQSEKTISNLTRDNDILVKEHKHITKQVAFCYVENKEHKKQIKIRDIIIDKLQAHISICEEVQKLIKAEGN